MRTRAALALAVGALLLAAPTAQAVGPPLIAETWVEEVKADSVRLRAKISPNGASSTYRFEYVAQSAFEQSGFATATKIPLSGPAPLGSGTGFLLVTQQVGPPLSPLKPASAYRYRVSAKNEKAEETGPTHVFATQQSELAFGLPDDRGWEMVSPIDKGGGAIAAPEGLFGGGVQQASPANGERAAAIAYSSSTSFGAAHGAPPVDQYLSTRTPNGWLAENVSAPLDSAAYGDEPDGAPYRLFAEGLSAGLLFGGLPCRGDIEGCPAPNSVLAGSGAPPPYMAYYLRDSNGAYSSLLSAADLAHTSLTPEAFSVSFAAASADLSHVVLSSCAALSAQASELPDGKGGCEAAAQNLYVKSAGSPLRAINLLAGESKTSPGAKLAAPIGALSADGSRAYFTHGGSLYLREGALSKPLPAAAQFQSASADGSVAFFTQAGHLHRYLAQSETTTDLTPAGGVVGVLGAAEDGAVIYYQDGAGIERWAKGTTTQVAAGSGAAKESDYPPWSATARVSPDGSHLLFLSSEELTAYDSDGRTEAYLYGPPLGGGAPQLSCVSCNPTGERANGQASIPGTPANGSTLAYRPRALSANGHRLFFDSTDKLAVADTNNQPDVYQWEARGEGDCNRDPGCVSLISSGRALGGASLIDASADGTDAYFITDESLIGTDPGSIDLYDARVSGGFPEAPRPIPCIADACQALPPTPEDPDPGTLVKSSGNPAPSYAVEAKKRHRKKKGRGRGKRRKGQHHLNGKGKYHVPVKRGARG
jgi:hypothetical protein